MITADELRRVPLFAALPDNEAASLAARVADVRLREGDWLIQEGEQPSFFLLLEGSLEVRKVVHGVERRITQYSPGRVFRRIAAAAGVARHREPARARAFACRAARPGRFPATVHVVRDAGVRADAHDDAAGLAAAGARGGGGARERRRSSAIASTSHAITCAIFSRATGSRSAGSTRRARGESGEIEPPRPGDRYPVVILASGERLVTPTLRELAQKLGLQTAPANTAYDLAIIGGGPAGLAAAVYGASEGLTTILIEREAAGRPGRHVVAHRELPGVSHRACPARS